MTAIRAVVFDLDDTLYPERTYVHSGFDAVANTFASVLSDPAKSVADMHRLFDSEHRPRVFNALLAERRLSNDAGLLRKMIHTYRSHFPKIQSHPDADAALARLRPSHRLGVISDGVSETQWKKIDALGLRSRLDFLVVTSDIGPDCGKPNPKAFQLAAESLGIDHRECVYVGDNPTKDFVAPNSLGWMTVRIVREDGIYRNAVAPSGGHPQHTIRSLDELDRLLHQRRATP